MTEKIPQQNLKRARLKPMNDGDLPKQPTPAQQNGFEPIDSTTKSSHNTGEPTNG